MKKILFVTLLALLMPYAFSQEEINTRFKDRKQKGYFNSTQIGMLMGNRQITEWYPSPYYYPSYRSLASSYYPYYYNTQTRTEMQISPSLTMTNGYMFNEHLAAGIGVGFEIFDRNHFPVFADIRYTLRDNDISPFFAGKIGYAFGGLNKLYDNITSPHYVSNTYYKKGGGFMLNPEMGVKIPLSENADLLFTVAYRYQKMKSKVTQKYYNYTFNEWNHKENFNRLSFGAAIMFR